MTSDSTHTSHLPPAAARNDGTANDTPVLFTDPKTVRLMLLMSESALWYCHTTYGEQWLEQFLANPQHPSNTPTPPSNSAAVTPQELVEQVWQAAAEDTAALTRLLVDPHRPQQVDVLTALVVNTYITQHHLTPHGGDPLPTEFAQPLPDGFTSHTFLPSVSDTVPITSDGGIDVSLTHPVTAVRLLDHVFLTHVVHSWPTTARLPHTPTIPVVSTPTSDEAADDVGAAERRDSSTEGISATRHATLTAAVFAVLLLTMVVVMPQVQVAHVAVAFLLGLLAGTVTNEYVKRRSHTRPGTVSVLVNRRVRNVVKDSPRLQHIARTHTHVHN